MRHLCLCGLLVVIGIGLKSSQGDDLNCQSINSSLGDLCTACTLDAGGGYFKCDVPNTYRYCESTPGTGFRCAGIENNCTGTRTNYATSLDCMMGMNSTGTASCGSKFGFATLNISHQCP